MPTMEELKKIKEMERPKEPEKARPKRARKEKPKRSLKEQPQEKTRLDYLIEQAGLPEYLTVFKGDPAAINRKDISPIARQAAGEWVGVAEAWSLFEGKIIGYFPNGVYVQIGEHILEFDLEQLWRSIGVIR